MSAADQVPHGRLYLRALQLLLLSKWRPHRDPLNREIPLPEPILREVWKFWESEIHLSRGVLLHPSQTLHVHRRVQFRLGSP
jgi:hypothetical protein